MGWSELEGVADRTNFDLTARRRGGKSLTVYDEATGEHVVPFVIEPAMGVDRATLTVLVDGYAEEEVAGEKRVVLRIRRRWRRSGRGPAALRNRPELVEIARR